jgi:anhydro-N-acetylmuramic acid kinase
MIRIFESASISMQPRSGLGSRDAQLNRCDQLATACLITARAIQRAIARFLPAVPDEIIVSGGGAANRTIMRCLRAGFPIKSWLTTDDLGIPSAAKEAVAFALLAAATLDGIPSNVPSATGARRRVVLGSITPKP